jgi:hypothetical protein
LAYFLTAQIKAIVADVHRAERWQPDAYRHSSLFGHVTSREGGQKVVGLAVLQQLVVFAANPSWAQLKH